MGGDDIACELRGDDVPFVSQLKHDKGLFFMRFNLLNLLTFIPSSHVRANFYRILVGVHDDTRSFFYGKLKEFHKSNLLSFTSSVDVAYGRLQRSMVRSVCLASGGTKIFRSTQPR